MFNDDMTEIKDLYSIFSNGCEKTDIEINIFAILI